MSPANVILDSNKHCSYCGNPVETGRAYLLESGSLAHIDCFDRQKRFELPGLEEPVGELVEVKYKTANANDSSE